MERKEKQVCEQCGSDDIEHVAHIRPNEGDRITWRADDACFVWCESCEAWGGGSIPESEFELRLRKAIHTAPGKSLIETVKAAREIVIALSDYGLRYMAYVDDIAPECPIAPELRKAADAYCADLDAWLSSMPITDAFYLQAQERANMAPIDAYLALGYLDTGISFGAGENSPLARADDIESGGVGECLADDLKAHVGAAAAALDVELQKLCHLHNSGDAHVGT